MLNVGVAAMHAEILHPEPLGNVAINSRKNLQMFSGRPDHLPKTQWDEIWPVRMCTVSHVGGIDGHTCKHTDTHTVVGRWLEQRVSDLDSHSPREASDGKQVWQTGGACAYLSVFVTSFDRDIRFSVLKHGVEQSNDLG